MRNKFVQYGIYANSFCVYITSVKCCFTDKTYDGLLSLNKVKIYNISASHWYEENRIIQPWMFLYRRQWGWLCSPRCPRFKRKTAWAINVYTYTQWQDLGMHWPCRGQKVNGQGHSFMKSAAGVGTCMSIRLLRFLVLYNVAIHYHTVNKTSELRRLLESNVDQDWLIILHGIKNSNLKPFVK